MRRLGIIYVIAAALMAAGASSATLLAQEYSNVPVEISKEKVRIDGKICYSHIVKEKQTLFSICKAYDVTIEDIHKFNPSVKENGLKKNSVILIPAKDTPKATQKAVEPESQAEDKPAEAVEIKVTEEKPANEPVRQKNAKRVHIAKWYEDLDVIADQYGVTAEAIMQANNLKGRKLSKRQKLIIPYPEDISPVVREDITIVTKTDSLAVSDSTASEKEQAIVIAPKTSVDAAIVLPLTTEDGKPNRNNMDFYSGALLAIYDLAEMGIGCNLNVYDIMDKRSDFSVESIEGSDVVIGPVSAADITKLFNAAPKVSAVVSPLDPRTEKLSGSHPNLILAPTPHATQYNDLIKWVEEDFREGDRAVLITEKGARQSGITAAMKESLDSSSFAYNTFSYSILEGRDVTKPLIDLMTTEGANRIIVASDSEAFVNDVVRNLNLLIYNNLDIVLYAPSRVRGFETIEVENFHNTSMHISLGYYIDYESDKVKDFLKKYRALYNTEPTQFAFQGYDLTKYFLELSAKYGDNWKEKLSESPAEMMQSTFRFDRRNHGGFINNGVRRIIYDKGYQIRKVK